MSPSPDQEHRHRIPAALRITAGMQTTAGDIAVQDIVTKSSVNIWTTVASALLSLMLVLGLFETVSRPGPEVAIGFIGLYGIYSQRLVGATACSMTSHVLRLPCSALTGACPRRRLSGS